MPNLIKCRKQTLNKYWYSRFFDVAVFDVSDLSEFKNLDGFISISNDIPESVHVSYIDPTSRNVIKVLPSVEGPITEAHFVFPESLKNVARVTTFRNFLYSKISEFKS